MVDPHAAPQSNSALIEKYSNLINKGIVTQNMPGKAHQLGGQVLNP
jgi:hypothetical protein